MKVEVTKELVDRYRFADSRDCALYHACENAGLPVVSVGTSAGSFYNDMTFTFTPRFGLAEYNQIKETGKSFWVEVSE